MSKKILWITVGTVVVLGLITWGVLFLVDMGYHNSEVDLRTQAEAQQEANKTVKDKVWRVLKQKAQIPEKYAEDWNKNYATVMGARYQGETKGAPVFKWIQEHNPSYTVELYKSIMDDILPLQNEFTLVQQKLIDVKREHMRLLRRQPSSWFLKGTDTLKIVIVLSTSTNEAFRTGVDDDVQLFGTSPAEKSRP